jgi:hypothetical protein
MSKAAFFDAGFLSDQLQGDISKFRENNADWFALLDDLAICLQQTASKACDTVKGSPFEPHPLGLLVLHRSNGLFQGAIIMLERGMIVEAKTLTRSVLECAFVMAGLHDKPEDVKAMMISDMDAAKKGQAKAILKSGAGKDTQALEDRIKEFGKVKNLSIDELAELGLLKGLYLHYRVLSNDAAHPSGKSLRRHMNFAPDGASWGGYLFGPGGDVEIASTANTLAMIGVALGVAFQQMIGDTENNARMGDLAARIERVRTATKAAPAV